MEFQPADLIQCFTDGLCADKGSDHDPVSFTGLTPPGMQWQTKKIKTSGTFVPGNTGKVYYSGLLGICTQFALGQTILY